MSHRLRLARIVEAIENLYQNVETPPGDDWKPPGWLVSLYENTTAGKIPIKPGERPNHAWLIGAAAESLLNALPESIAESNLDRREKSALIQLREAIIALLPLAADDDDERFKLLAVLDDAVAALRTKNSEAKPAGVLPFSVKQWLVAKYLAAPSPREFQIEQDRLEPVVFVAFEDFTDFLQGEEIDILPNLDAWKNAGWTVDYKEDLPSGEERRLVGIRKAVLHAPTSPSEGKNKGRDPGKPGDDLPPPEWIKDLFRSKQYELLKLLWGNGKVAERKLCDKMGYKDSRTREENLKRRVTETNKNLCARSEEIGALWAIKERTRDGIKLYYLSLEK